MLAFNRDEIWQTEGDADYHTMKDSGKDNLSDSPRFGVDRTERIFWSLDFSF